MGCFELTSGYTLDCANPVKGGVEADVILINFNDWLESTYTTSASNELVIETLITLPTGKLAYKFEGYANTLRPSSSFSRVEGRPSYTHTVAFQIPSAQAEQLKQASQLGGGRFVAIVFTNNQTIEVYGHGTGLQLADNELRNAYTFNGGIQITLASNDETLEVLPNLIYQGPTVPYDFATAKAEIEALLV